MTLTAIAGLAGLRPIARAHGADAAAFHAAAINAAASAGQRIAAAVVRERHAVGGDDRSFGSPRGVGGRSDKGGRESNLLWLRGVRRDTLEAQKRRPTESHDGLGKTSGRSMSVKLTII